MKESCDGVDDLAYASGMSSAAQSELLLNTLIAERINALLAEKERSGNEVKQDVIAAALGVEQGTISKILHGRKDGTRPAFTISYIRAFANLLGVPMGFLMPSEQEVETGKLERRDLPKEGLPASEVRRNLRPQLEEFLRRHRREIPPRATEALELSNPEPDRGEDADEFYWRFVRVVSVNPPFAR